MTKNGRNQFVWQHAVAIIHIVLAAIGLITGMMERDSRWIGVFNAQWQLAGIFGIWGELARRRGQD